MADLSSRLLEAIEKAERLAEAASPAPWHANAEHDEVDAEDDITVCYGFALSGPQLRATVDHIVLHDPTAVMRRCAADREIVELYRDSTKMHYDSDAPHVMLEVIEVLARAYGLSDHQEGEE